MSSSRQLGLGNAPDRIVYITIPIVISGSHIEVDLTDDGEPGPWGNTWVTDDERAEKGYWELDFSEEYYIRAWDWLIENIGKEISTT